MAETARMFSKGEFIGGIVAALAVGFFVGSMFMELRLGSQAVTQGSGQATSQAASQGAGPAADGQDHSAELAHISELEITTAQKPGDQAAWVELGNLYFDTHQARKAIGAYEKAVALGVVSADVWTDLGIMHREAGEPKKAIETFDTALKLNPTHENALYNRGVVLLHDLKDSAGAVVTWERLLKANPQARNPEGRSMQGIVDELKKG